MGRWTRRNECRGLEDRLDRWKWRQGDERGDGRAKANYVFLLIGEGIGVKECQGGNLWVPLFATEGWAPVV